MARARDRLSARGQKAGMNSLADRIVAARLAGTELGDAPRLSLDEGYAVQDAVAAGLGALAGWKIGATNAGGQRFLGVTGPIFGRVPQSGLRQSGERVALGGERPAEAEPEILFRLGADGTVAATHLGIEINRPSRADVFELGVGFIVADNAAHAALVIGPAIPLAALDMQETVTVSLIRDGETVSTGDAAAVLGHPLRALEALSREHPLREGDWIATGAMARACPFAPGDTVVADFGALGRVVAHW